MDLSFCCMEAMPSTLPKKINQITMMKLLGDHSKDIKDNASAASLTIFKAFFCQLDLYSWIGS